MKKCPYCAEEIQDKAIICTHCGRDIVIKEPKQIILSIQPPNRPFIYVAAAGLIIGGFLPSATIYSNFGSISIYGIQGDGVITAFIGVVLGVVALTYKDQKKDFLDISF